MKIFLTGGSGYLGRVVIAELLKSDQVDNIYCLIHSTPLSISDDRIHFIKGDICNLSSVALDEEIDVCLSMSGVTNGKNISLEQAYHINYAGTKSLISFCKDHRIKKFAFVSSVNAGMEKRGAYGESKLRAEAAVKKSGLEYVIFRPALIYGRDCKRGLTVIEEWIRHFGFVPVFGDGKKYEQPIPVNECAAFITYYLLHNAEGRTISLYGKTSMTYDVLCQTMAKCIGKKVRLIHVPAAASATAIEIIRKIYHKFPISPEQIYHVDCNLCGDMKEIYQETGIAGEDFEPVYRREVLKQAGDRYCA